MERQNLEQDIQDLMEGKELVAVKVTDCLKGCCGGDDGSQGLGKPIDPQVLTQEIHNFY